MTDIIDRYVAAVTGLLPTAQRADIAAELREALDVQTERRERELGRKLNRGELEALVKAFGNPVVIAGRYRGEQSLIGPEIFPFWRVAMSIATGVILTVHLILLIINSVMFGVPGEGPSAGQDIAHILNSAVVAFVWAFTSITITAALFERYGVTRHLVTGWRPRDLPPVNTPRRGFYDRVTEIALSLIFILWLAGAIHFLGEGTPWGANIEVRVAGAVEPIRYTLIALSALMIVHACYAIVRPARVFTISATSLVLKIGFLIAFAWLLQVGDFVDIIGAALNDPAKTNQSVDLGIHIGLYIATIVSAIDVVMEARRTWRARPRAGASAALAA